MLNSAVAVPVLKILFLENVTREGYFSVHKLLMHVSNQQGGEVITYPQSDCKELVRILNFNHELLPQNKRYFNVMKVTFVRRK